MITALVFALAQSNPTVAILPVINRTTEENEKLRGDMVSLVSEFLPKAFSANGFQVIPSESVTLALKQLSLDLEDEELHRREILFKVGEAVKADYLYFTTIESTGFFTDNAGRATLRVWFLDVKNKARILSSKAVLGESKQRVGGSPKSAEVTATARAAEQSLKAITKHFNATYKAPN